PPLHAVLRWAPPVRPVPVLDHADRVGGRPDGDALPGDERSLLDPLAGEALALLMEVVDAHVGRSLQPPGAAGVLVPDEYAHVQAVDVGDLRAGVVEVLDEPQHEPGLLRGGPEALELRPVLEEDADVSVVVPRDHAALAHRSEESAVVQPVVDAGRVEELDGCREGLDDQLAAAVRRLLTSLEVGRVTLPRAGSAGHQLEVGGGT